MSDNESQQDPGDTPEATSGTSPADSDHSGGTSSPDDATLGGISDDQLPEDLQPGEDNPLAEPLDPDDEATKSREELQMDATQEDLGNHDGASQEPGQSGDEDEGAGQATREPDAGTTDTSTDASTDTDTDANRGDGAQGGGIAGG